MEEVDTEEQVSCKAKSKKKSICRLLMQRKTKVGCLSTDSDDLNLTEMNPESCVKQSEKSFSVVKSNSNSPDLEKTKIQLTKESVNDDTETIGDELNRIDSPKESGNSTKLALCCAMTESSRSLNVQHINNHKNDNYKKISQAEEKVDKNSSESNITADLQQRKIIKVASIDSNIANESSANCQEKKHTSIHDPVSPGSKHSCSQSPTVSEVSSCNSSPLPFSAHAHFKRRNLVHQRSADNLLLTSRKSSVFRHSSPEASRSIPEARDCNIRSISHDMMLTTLRADKNRNMSLSDDEKQDVNGCGFAASMDSLARHSLLAAHVLHLIPTNKARERNFLHGRIAADPLLGVMELEKTLPQRELRVFVGTWNMNGQSPPRDLDDFMLPSDLEHVPDLIAIGTQESYSERFEWEVSIQETIGPSHILFHSATLGTLHLALFLRRDLLWFCSLAEDSSYSVRPGTAFKTKGAVAISFTLFGTSFLFITAHLTAHQEKVKERIHDVKKIMRSLDLPKIVSVRHKSKDVTQNFDCVFWFGDLNFRLAQPREEVVQWVSEQQFPLPKPVSLVSDQLRSSRAEGTVFRDFDEGPITFPPTYKYDPGTQNFDTSHKQRTPSYTDRILFKGWKGRRGSKEPTSKKSMLECLWYTSVPSITTSDHKPVWGLYRCVVRPGIDTIPLAAGLFNRDVYLEGIKRRAASLSKRHGTSTACVIQ